MGTNWDRFNNGFDREIKPTDDSATNERVQKRIKDFQYLAGNRGNWNTHWTEIAQRIWPAHSNLFQTIGTIQPQGDKRNTMLYDSTGLQALSKFASILDSLLTPRNSFWHHLRPADNILMRDKATRIWFEKANEILFKQRYAATANFSSQNQSVFKSLGAYGTGVMLTDDLAGSPGLRYRNIHLSECFLEENHQGVIDGLCRYFKLTARQAVQMFGIEACPKEITEIYKDFPERESFFLHWVKPREERDPERKDFKGMKYASEYISMQGTKMVAEGGYHTFPYSPGRYEQAPNEPYGRSPAMDALPSIKTLSEQKKAMLKQGQRALDPILLVHDDGILDAFSMVSGTTVSGGITADGRPLVQPLPTGNLQVGEEMMNEERRLIEDTFFVSIFKLLEETREMTAREIIERTREKGILLTPVGRQQSEYLGPLIDRELDILSRQGQLPPQPPMLKSAKGEYKITWDSPISRTQKAEWAAGAQRTIETLLNYAQIAQDPSVLDVLDMDVVAPQIAEINGTPASWIRDSKDIAQRRQVRQQQMQQQQAIDAAPAAASVMKTMQGAK